MDRMSGMVVFTRVVEAASFSEAGRQLGLSKSAVSKQVSQLEARLGAQLLHRTTRRLSLTEVGRCFYERCAQIVREVEEVELAVTRLQTSPRGQLRVNVPMSFGQLCLAPVLPEFLQKNPDVQAALVLDDRKLNAVEGGFDVTIRIAGRLEDSSLIARRIAPNRLVVCASPGYLRRRGTPETPADLVRHDCLLYTLHQSRETWRFGAPGPLSVEVSGRLRANNGDALREAALAGLGLAQLPFFIVEAELRRHALLPVLCSFEDRSTSIWALYSPTRHLSAKVRAFVDFLAERFGSDPDQGTRGTPQSGARSPLQRPAA